MRCGAGGALAVLTSGLDALLVVTQPAAIPAAVVLGAELAVCDTVSPLCTHQVPRKPPTAPGADLQNPRTGHSWTLPTA